jgi:hypothetical protein
MSIFLFGCGEKPSESVGVVFTHAGTGVVAGPQIDLRDG